MAEGGEVSGISGISALWDVELALPSLNCAYHYTPILPSTRLCRLFYVNEKLVKVTRSAVEYMAFCIQLGSVILDAACHANSVFLLLGSGEVVCISCSSCMARLVWRQRIMLPNREPKTIGIVAEPSGQYIAIMDGAVALYSCLENGLKFCGRFRLPLEDDATPLPRPMALTWDLSSDTGPLLWIAQPSRQPRIRVCSVTETICTLPIDYDLGEIRQIWTIRHDAVAICRKHGVTAVNLSDALSGNTVGRRWIPEQDPQAYDSTDGRLFSIDQSQILELHFFPKVSVEPINSRIVGSGSNFCLNLNGDSICYEVDESPQLSVEHGIIDRNRLFTSSSQGISVFEPRNQVQELMQEPCPPLNRLLWLDPKWLFLVTSYGTTVLEYDGNDRLLVSESFSESQNDSLLAVGEYDENHQTFAIISPKTIRWYQISYGKIMLLSVNSLPARAIHAAVCYGLALVYIENHGLIKISPTSPPETQYTREDVTYLKNQSENELIVGFPREVQLWSANGTIRHCYSEEESTDFAQLGGNEDYAVCRKNLCATKWQVYEFCSPLELVECPMGNRLGSVLGNDGEHLWLIGSSGAIALSHPRKGPISAACVAYIGGNPHVAALVVLQCRGKLLALRVPEWTSAPPITATHLRGPPDGSLSILQASLVLASTKNQQIYLYDLRTLHRLRVNCTSPPHKASLTRRWTFYSSDIEQGRWEHLLVVDGLRLLSYSLSRVESTDILLKRRLKHELPTVPKILTTNDDTGDILIAKKERVWCISVKVSQKSVEMGKWEEFTCPGEVQHITGFQTTAIVSTTRGTWTLHELRNQTCTDRFRLAQVCPTHYVGYIAGRTVVLIADQTVFLTAYEYKPDERFKMLMRIHGPPGTVKALIPVNDSAKLGKISVLAVLENDPESAWKIEIDENDLENKIDTQAIRPGLW